MPPGPATLTFLLFFSVQVSSSISFPPNIAPAKVSAPNPSAAPHATSRRFLDSPNMNPVAAEPRAGLRGSDTARISWERPDTSVNVPVAAVKRRAVRPTVLKVVVISEEDVWRAEKPLVSEIGGEDQAATAEPKARP